MRQWLAILCLVLVVAVAARAQAATTDRDAFEKVLKKGSTLDSEKNKFGCACLTGDPPNAAGVLRRVFNTGTGSFQVQCFIQVFNANGTKFAEGTCNDWVPVGR